LSDVMDAKDLEWILFDIFPYKRSCAPKAGSGNASVRPAFAGYPNKISKPTF